MALPKVTPLDKPYTTDIRGYGEIYEIESVHKVQRHWCSQSVEGIGKLGPAAYILCIANLEHNKRTGMSLDKLQQYVVAHDPPYFYVSSGFMDSPPWKSDPLKHRKNLGRTKMFLSRLVFRVMVYFEKATRENSHMIYAIVVPRKRLSE